MLTKYLSVWRTRPNQAEGPSNAGQINGPTEEEAYKESAALMLKAFICFEYKTQPGRGTFQHRTIEWADRTREAYKASALMLAKYSSVWTSKRGRQRRGFLQR